MAAVRVPFADLAKGRPPLRKCPEDFEVIFVEQGRVGCEAWYRARRDTVTRWMHECDARRGRAKPTMIAARAAYVAHQRREGKWMTRSSRLVEHHEIKRPSIREAIHDRRKVSVLVARHAAQHLRIVRNGGFIVSPAPNEEWWVGSKRLSAAQMLDFAERRGFDATGSADDPDPCHEGVGPKPLSARPGTPEQRAQWNADWAARFSAEREGADLKLGANWQDKDL